MEIILQKENTTEFHFFLFNEDLHVHNNNIHVYGSIIVRYKERKYKYKMLTLERKTPLKKQKS